MTTLTCDSCTETADDVRQAFDHVRANPAHAMTGVGDDDVTFKVETVRDEDIVEDDDDDDWYGPEDDWADQ